MAYGYFSRTFSQAASPGGTFFPGQDRNADAPQVSQNTSFMQKLMPNTSFELPAIKVETFDPTQHTPGAVLQAAQDNAGGAELQLNQAQTAFDAAWSTAQNQAMSTMHEVAKDMDISAGRINATFPSSESSDVFNLGAQFGPDLLANGAGSFVTGTMQGAGALNEIHQEGSKLSKDELDSLMAETYARLSSGGPQDALLSMTSAPAPQALQSPFQFENLGGPDQLLAFIQAPQKDQPEQQEFDARREAIEDIQQNHQIVEASMFDNTGNKLAVAVSEGDTDVVAKISGEDGQKMIEAVQDGQSVASAAEILYQVDSLNDVKMTTPEILDLDREAKMAVASLNNEMRLKLLEPGTTPGFNTAA